MLWGDEHEVTAIEIDPATAEYYGNKFKKDTVIVGDAHQYLLENYMNFDVIVLGPPCQSHSDIRRCGVHRGQYKAQYPDMVLYQEILLLKHFCPPSIKFCVENVVPYYDPLIKPSVKIGRHFFWSNFHIDNFNMKENRVHQDITPNSTLYDVNLYHTTIENKRAALRNMVNPHLGLHILQCALRTFDKKSTQTRLFE